MIFWTGIFFGVVFAYFAVKIGFYEIWITLFNIAVSIYLSIFLGPVITENVPKIGIGNTANKEYVIPLIILATAIVAFLILHTISFLLFMGRFKVPFPKIFDTLFAGIWGFLTGALIWSFLVLLICMTPISKNTYVKGMGFAGQPQEAKTSHVNWWCDLINMVVFNKENYLTTEAAIENLHNCIEKTADNNQVSDETKTNMADPIQCGKKSNSLSDLTSEITDINDANN